MSETRLPLECGCVVFAERERAANRLAPCTLHQYQGDLLIAVEDLLKAARHAGELLSKAHVTQRAALRHAIRRTRTEFDKLVSFVKAGGLAGGK